MNAKLDALLCAEHPLLFASRNASIRDTAMCWGFDCGDGWYAIIKEAADKLEPLIAAAIARDPDIATYGLCSASQVKEKFGTLHFYMSSSTDEMDAIVWEAEQKSAEVCEECGKPGKLRGRGWRYTACKAHVRNGG